VQPVPKYVDCLNRLADGRFLGDLELRRIKNDAEKGLSSTPDEAGRWYFVLSRVYWRTDELDKALHSLERAAPLLRHTDLSRDISNLRLLMFLANGDYQSALLVASESWDEADHDSDWGFVLFANTAEALVKAGEVVEGRQLMLDLLNNGKHRHDPGRRWILANQLAAVGMTAEFLAVLAESLSSNEHKCDAQEILRDPESLVQQMTSRHLCEAADALASLARLPEDVRSCALLPGPNVGAGPDGTLQMFDEMKPLRSEVGALCWQS